TEMHLLLGLVVVAGAQHDEEVLVVVLDLGALVGEMGILHRELVQAEELLELFEIALVGVVQADPDELAVAGRPCQLGGLLRRQLLLMLARAVLVMGAIDDHLDLRLPLPPRALPSCRWARPRNSTSNGSLLSE